MNSQSTAGVVVDETWFSEPVHEETDARSGGADHLCQGLLTDLGNYNLRHAVLPEVSEQQQNSSESLFAGIEELVNQNRMFRESR